MDHESFKTNYLHLIGTDWAITTYEMNMKSELNKLTTLQLILWT